VLEIELMYIILVPSLSQSPIRVNQLWRDGNYGENSSFRTGSRNRSKHL